jgi:hypothetical protein
VSAVLTAKLAAAESASVAVLVSLVAVWNVAALEIESVAVAVSLKPRSQM